jgi:hypothetical protein
MLREHRFFGIGLALVAVSFGCGGPAAPADQPAAEPAGGAGGPPATAEQPAEKPPSLEGERPGFMKSCAQQSQSEQFCACAFEQFKEAFKDADLSKPPPPDDPRLLDMQKRTASVCSSKLTEEDVKNAFNRRCVAGDERKAAYCNCAWTSLRKKVPFAEFVGEMNEAKLLEPKKAMVIECKGKYPTDAAKFDFMSACTDGDSSMEKACGCRWDKIKKQFTTEEIVAGTADVEKVKGLEACK